MNQAQEQDKGRLCSHNRLPAHVDGQLQFVIEQEPQPAEKHQQRNGIRPIAKGLAQERGPCGSDCALVHGKEAYQRDGTDGRNEDTQYLSPHEPACDGAPGNPPGRARRPHVRRRAPRHLAPLSPGSRLHGLESQGRGRQALSRRAQTWRSALLSTARPFRSRRPRKIPKERRLYHTPEAGSPA